MAQLSYVNTGVKQNPDINLSIPTDESIGAILFDISGFDSPFASYPLLYHNFKDNAIQRVKNMDDASLLGIVDDGFLNGMVYYHLSQFYDFVGDDQILYIAFADCSKDWDVIQKMQQDVAGRLFQIGVWTSQPIWRRKDDETLGFTSLITDLQHQADEINGKVGVATHTMVPLNIILCGNSNYVGPEDEADFRALPNAVELDCPKVSVVLAQNGSAEVVQMQKQNPLQAPVSAIGMVMACLALCGAEESIASLAKCDLNKNEGFNFPEWGMGEGGTPMDDPHYVWRNIITSQGYIIPVDYEGVEASYYLSSDQTLSNGQFGTIANNRVMHKCRRAFCMALIPYVHSDQMYDPSSHNISISAIAFMSEAVYTSLDAVMVNKLGQNQISSREVTFQDNDELLENDTLSIHLEIGPVNYSGLISEEVSHDIN